jgi:fatty acid desaturase
MATPLKKKKVYCKECKHFFSKLNDMYYMNSEAYPVPNPIPIHTRQSHYKHHVVCNHPDNHKEHVEYVQSYDEIRERRYKDVKSPRNLNYSNDCFWFTKKEETEPDWEK